MPKTLHLQLTPRAKPGREQPAPKIKRLDATKMTIEKAQQLINYAINRQATVDFRLSSGVSFTLDPRVYQHITVIFDEECEDGN